MNSTYGMIGLNRRSDCMDRLLMITYVEISRLMHPEFKIQEVFPERFANPINKRLSVFIRFASLEGNISCVLNSKCINFHILHIIKWFLFLQSLFYTVLAFSNDIIKFCDVRSSTFVGRRDGGLREIFLCSWRKYFLLGIINYISRRNYWKASGMLYCLPTVLSTLKNLFFFFFFFFFFCLALYTKDF